MQSAKKRAKVLSALSIAAGATMVTQMASGAVLTMFYDNLAVVDNTYSYPGPAIGTETFPFSAPGGGNVVSTPAITQGSINTVTMSVGEVLEFGLDAVLTGNANPNPTKALNNNITQPTNLGLAQLATRIPSSDGTGTTLTPLSDGTGSHAIVGGNPSYNSTAQINQSSAIVGTGADTGINGVFGGTTVPSWQLQAPGDVVPAAPGQGGQVGVGFQSVGGNVSASGTTSGGRAILQYFAGTGPTITQSTDFFDSLAYQANKAGLVTLTPAADATGTTYWTINTTGTATSTNTYRTSFFTGGSDSFTALPALVVDITGGVTPPVSQPLFSLGTSAPATYGNQLTNSATPGADQGVFSTGTNKLTVTGGNQSYKVASATGINGGSGDATNYVEANGFNPATDPEIYALDVLVNGVAANATQLTTLLTEASLIGGLPTGMSLTLTAPLPDPFASNYNLFADVASGDGAADNFFGFDLSSSNDSNLAGYSVSAVAVVPEPMSLGLLALGGLGLMSRRHRRNNKA